MKDVKIRTILFCFGKSISIKRWSTSSGSGVAFHFSTDQQFF